MLASQNPLDIDSDVMYDDATHTYASRSQPTKRFVSVTSVVSKRMPPFNARLISAKLSKSTRGRYAGKSATEIRDMWSNAARMGTDLHAAIELFFNGGPQVPHAGFKHVLHHLTTTLGLVPWRTELKMVGKTSSIAGTADMVLTKAGQSAKDGVIIVDWKRTDAAPKDSRYDMCRKELAHVPAGKFWKFALQLNLYAHLLQDACSISTTKLLLVLLHPDNTNFSILDVPMMPEAATIFRTLN